MNTRKWTRRGVIQALPALPLGLTAMMQMGEGVAHGATGVTVERVNYKNWNDAVRMSNGEVEVVVVPSIGGRVMRYGFVGRPNMLWENPTVAGKPIPLGEWPNTGGDKAWVWPQDDWGKLLPKAWPPPPAADQAGHSLTVVGTDTVRLESGRVVPWGVRIVRDIRLAPTGTNVHLTTRFVRETAGQSPECAVWTITQVPATPAVWAKLLPSATRLLGDAKPMSDKPFQALRRTGNVVQVERDPANSTKIGLEADMLATVQNNTLFAVRMGNPRPDNAFATYQKGERAQIYNQPDNADDAKRGITPYIELEMTSPRRVLKQDETITLAQIWQLQPLVNGERTNEAIVELLDRPMEL
jgi:hypothetical protein